jgi:hypothetical protein
LDGFLSARRGCSGQPHYTWYWFERLRAFFRKTADEGRAMVFTADQ